MSDSGHSKGPQGVPTSAAELPRLDSLEIHSGVVLGRRRGSAPPMGSRTPGLTPMAALEGPLLEALRHRPCHVAYSGGRDSAAILAAATRVAREHGLPDPIPLTARFKDFPNTWEADWQELTVEHLGLGAWRQIELTTEFDALGAAATQALTRYGLYYPSQAHSAIVFAEAVGSGSLVTGGGGDEVFSRWGGRPIPRRRLARLRPRRRAAKWLAASALPRRARQRAIVRRRPVPIPWLREAAQREFERRRLLTYGGSPERSWADSLEGLLSSRYLEFVGTWAATFAQDAGVRLVEPFYDPSFVRSLAGAAPPAGYVSRSEALQATFGGMLPDSVWERSTKADFTEAGWGPAARSFVASWNGDGLDASLINPERLAQEWSKPRPDARSLVCLAQAWLSTEGCG